MLYPMTQHIFNVNEFPFPFQAQNGDKNRIMFLLDGQDSLEVRLPVLPGLLLRLEVLLLN